MEWNDEAIARLRTLWAEGHSTAEIGRRLGITKNAVVGKAHRLSLAARPSPIRRPEASQAAKPAAPRRVSGPTLHPVSSEPVAAPPAPRGAPRPQPALHAVPLPARNAPRVPACCWPIGEPGTAAFRFCGDPAMVSKPYCATHAAIAYVKVRDRREDAA